MESRLKKIVRWMAERRQLRKRQETRGPRCAEVCLYGLVDSSFLWPGGKAAVLPSVNFLRLEMLNAGAHVLIAGCLGVRD